MSIDGSAKKRAKTPLEVWRELLLKNDLETAAYRMVREMVRRMEHLAAKSPGFRPMMAFDNGPTLRLMVSETGEGLGFWKNLPKLAGLLEVTLPRDEHVNAVRRNFFAAAPDYFAEAVEGYVPWGTIYDALANEEREDIAALAGGIEEPLEDEVDNVIALEGADGTTGAANASSLLSALEEALEPLQNVLWLSAVDLDAIADGDLDDMEVSGYGPDFSHDHLKEQLKPCTIERDGRQVLHPDFVERLQSVATVIEVAQGKAALVEKLPVIRRIIGAGAKVRVDFGGLTVVGMAEAADKERVEGPTGLPREAAFNILCNLLEGEAGGILMEE